jgi:AbrB family transcriptional regulator, transcriptional pleiotropic regulator of transition state genes
MKLPGIARKPDYYGRITLPIEIRRRWGIEQNDLLEFAVEGDSIILLKCQSSCVFCGGADNIIIFKGKHICRECLSSLRRQAHDE